MGNLFFPPIVPSSHCFLLPLSFPKSPPNGLFFPWPQLPPLRKEFFPYFKAFTPSDGFFLLVQGSFPLSGTVAEIQRSPTPFRCFSPSHFSFPPLHRPQLFFKRLPFKEQDGCFSPGLFLVRYFDSDGLLKGSSFPPRPQPAL